MKGIRLVSIVIVLGFTVAAYADEPNGAATEVIGQAPTNQGGSHEEKPGRLWGGVLSKLKERGFAFELLYRGEALHSFGLEPPDATRYRGVIDLILSLDTEKAGLWSNGEFFLKGQNGHGQGINVNPGGVVLHISNIDARDFTQVSEYGLKQNFLSGDLRLIVGKQDVNKIFCVDKFGAHLINPSYTLIPTVPMPTFPAPAFGGSVFAGPAKWLSLGLGIYNGGKNLGSLGLDSAFEGEGGYFSIFEPAWKPSFGIGGRYPGNYRIGLWYHSGKFTETNPGQPPGKLSGNSGVYLIIDQLVYKEDGVVKDDRGLGVFFQFGWAPSDRNQVWGYVAVGCSYKGFLPARQDDTIGFGVSYTLLTGNQPTVGQKTQLTNVELFYEVQLTPWMSLRPDIQYFDNPGGGRNNGWAAGLRSVVQF